MGMITDFDDFCTWVYVIIDDIWQQLAPLFKRPGPTSEVSDSELITMAVVGECRGWDQETELISNWHEHTNLFPRIPERTRFNRRRRNLMFAINLIRKMVLQMMDLAQDDQCVIDSLPIPVVAFYLVPSSTGDWEAHGARFGKVPSKKETIFGYKLHLLITLNGLILDFELAPANAPDLNVGEELLANHANLNVIGDKGYISVEVAARLLRQNGIRLLTLRRRNQKQQLPEVVEHLINSVRQVIETVNGQLAHQFNIERTYAHSFWGLCARLHTKLTAHTLCIYINRLLGKTDFLQIKSLAFPNI
jgi:IS5 family transposase